MKKTLRVLGWILAILVVVLLTHPLWIEPSVKTLAPRIVNSVVGVEFKVERFKLNLYKGHFELGLLEMGNPEGFAERRALAVGRLAVDFDTLSAFGSTVYIHSVEVNDVFASYVEASGTNNWKKIASGNGEEKLDAEVEAAQTEDAGASGKKVVIDVLTVEGVKVRYGKIVLPLPIKLVLNDLGKDSNGASWAEIGNVIWQSFLKATGVIGNGLEVLGSATKQVGESGQQLLDRGSKVLDKGVNFLSDKLKVK